VVAAALGRPALAGCAGDAGLSSGPSGGSPNAFTGAVPASPGNPLAGNAAPAPPLDARDRNAPGAAHLRAPQFAQPGAPVPWRNPATRHPRTTVPGPAYQSTGRTCREFSHTVYVDEHPHTGRGSSCRNPDGTWTPLS